MSGGDTRQGRGSSPAIAKHLCKSGNLRVSKNSKKMNQSQTTAIPKLFIGMDVHKKSWTAHFKTDLFDNKTVTFPPETDVLINYVQKHFKRSRGELLL